MEEGKKDHNEPILTKFSEFDLSMHFRFNMCMYMVLVYMLVGKDDDFELLKVLKSDNTGMITLYRNDSQ